MHADRIQKNACQQVIAVSGAFIATLILLAVTLEMLTRAHSAGRRMIAVVIKQILKNIRSEQTDWGLSAAT